MVAGIDVGAATSVGKGPVRWAAFPVGSCLSACLSRYALLFVIDKTGSDLYVLLLRASSLEVT